MAHKTSGDKRALRLLPGFALYAALLVFALLFTQLLRSPLSTVFLVFMLILPFVSLLYTLIGRAVIQAYVTCDAVRTEKNTPVGYEIRIINSSFLPYPFLEADVSEPGDGGFKCFKKRLVFSLVPHGSCTVKDRVVFKYRGLYEIGVESIYISDPARMFSLRLDAANYAPVTVLPRKMTLSGDSSAFVTDSPLSSSSKNTFQDKTEISDIRDYVPGDPVKNIHWKLSSKTDDIKLRDFAAIEDRHVYVFCDLARHVSPPERSPLQVYENLKKMLSSDKSKRAVRIKGSAEAPTDGAGSEIPENVKELQSEIQNELQKKERSKKSESRKIGAKYKKNIRSGMTKEQAETIKMIDLLIVSTSKKNSPRAVFSKNSDGENKISDLSSAAEEKNENGASGAENGDSELEKIINSATRRENERDASRDAAFGGRLKKEFERDCDEFCADAVIEMTIAAVLDELRRGNTCTVAWFDSREDSGIARVKVSSEAEFESVYMKLATAQNAESDERAASLGIAIAESSNVTLKVVTSNIDPVSVSELSRLPSSLGGAGTGCFTKVYIFSPSERYENPLERRAYTAGICDELLQNGIFSSELTEGVDAGGAPVYLSV